MSKLLSLTEAVERHGPSGSSVAMGTALESLIPFAAGHELIRQQRRDLVMVGPISDMLFDQLIGAGCVGGIVAAWVGNVSAGLGHNYRRAVEHGIPNSLRLQEHSNFSVLLGLTASALGVPWMPTRTLLGSDLVARNQRLSRESDELLRVEAIQPGVTILHVQRADAQGHAHCWGNLGISKEAGMAARAVILVAEEIVPSEIILSDPNRILLPPHRVVAVCHVPGGAHPSPVQGYYARDHAAYDAYHAETRDRAGYERWLAEWVLDVPDRAAYLRKLGAAWPALKPTEPRLAEPVDYA